MDSEIIIQQLASQIPDHSRETGERYLRGHISQIESMAESLENETDRGLALGGAAFLEETLSDLLEDYFKASVANSGHTFSGRRPVDFLPGSKQEEVYDSFFGTSGILESFIQRAKLAFLLSLISQNTLEDLRYIAKIRNQFAHILAVSDFNNDTVNTLAMNLRMSKHLDVSDKSVKDKAKSRYFHAVASIGLVLLCTKSAHTSGFRYSYF